MRKLPHEIIYIGKRNSGPGFHQSRCPTYAYCILRTIAYCYLKELRLTFLSLAKNAVHLGATYWADSLSHTASRIRDLYMSFKGALLFALNAVSLAFVLFCHFDPPSAVRSGAAGSSCMSVRMSPPYPQQQAQVGFSTHKIANIHLNHAKKYLIYEKSGFFERNQSFRTNRVMNFDSG
jgi:hypothetical protein